jgi:hypothetical protein
MWVAVIGLATLLLGIRAFTQITVMAQLAVSYFPIAIVGILLAYLVTLALPLAIAAFILKSTGLAESLKSNRFPGSLQIVASVTCLVALFLSQMLPGARLPEFARALLEVAAYACLLFGLGKMALAHKRSD